MHITQVSPQRLIFQTRPYLRDVALLKRYGSERYKLVQLKALRLPGVETPYTPKSTVNAEKLSNNLSRARSKIQEYGYCNPWELFVTLTLRGDDHDRYDLKAFHRVFSQWIRDLRKSTGAPIHYLLVPEKHRDGAWHMHGLFYGLPHDQLVPFSLDSRLPSYIRSSLQQGRTLYNWPAYATKFGFVTAEPLRDKDCAVSYITKYITKDLASAVSELGAHLYYASKGLQQAVELKRGALCRDVPIDFQNEHCAITWFTGQAVDANALLACIEGTGQYTGGNA